MKRHCRESYLYPVFTKQKQKICLPMWQADFYQIAVYITCHSHNIYIRKNRYLNYTKYPYSMNIINTKNLSSILYNIYINTSSNIIYILYINTTSRLLHILYINTLSSILHIMLYINTLSSILHFLLFT